MLKDNFVIPIIVFGGRGILMKKKIDIKRKAILIFMNSCYILKMCINSTLPVIAF